MATHRIGTRASALARWQTDEVARMWCAVDPAVQIEIVEISTDGDELADAPLEKMEGTGFFTSTLEKALLEGRIDVAVHSYKDLPVEVTPELVVAAVPARGRVEDALCARDGLTLDRLPAGARVGTSSLRRSAQIRRMRGDLDLATLRGNVPTRLDRVARGDLDAVVLASAGLERLGMLSRAAEIFPIQRMLTAPAQGALAIQTRAAARGLRESLARLEHAATRRAVDAERAVLHALRGGCSVPVGAFARADEERVTLTAGVFEPSGARVLTVVITGGDPVTAGHEAAQRLLASGAGEILAALEREPRLAWEGTR